MSVFTALDVTGYSQRDGEPVWVSDRGVIVSLHFFDLVPDLPASLAAVDTLRARLAHVVAAAGGGLIEAEIEHVDEVPAVRQLLKVPRPGGPGQVFVGSYIIPKATCSAVVKAQAAEGPMTGLREALVLDQLGSERYFQPHPYAPQLREGLPFHAADAPEWDDRFPDHPLTQVRAALARIVPTVRFDARFRALPPYPGP